MNEAEARTKVEASVPRETFARLERLIRLIEDERHRQNLISAQSAAEIWNRHVLDSLQLLWLTPLPTGLWIDIGSGAGFPGLVIAIARTAPIALVEPRARRIAFLRRAVSDLDLAAHAQVIAGRIGSTPPMPTPAAIISARAVAPLGDLFALAERDSSRQTLWLLPKGRSAAEEVAAARATWQGDLRLVPSLSEPSAAIIVARDITRKTAR